MSPEDEGCWLPVETTVGLRVGTFSPTPTPTSREGRGAEDGIQLPLASDLIHRAYVGKPPEEPKGTGFGTPPGW